MRHLKLRVWLMANGLRQLDLADAITIEKGTAKRDPGRHPHDSFIAKRMRSGFSVEETKQILDWARLQRPGTRVQFGDLFETVPPR